ncbi:MAG TPA: hypothetical protein VFH66_16760 [Mycobacteriales bacterium]|nr:hypothetical protein [Mycobacteriales bacterium]
MGNKRFIIGGLAAGVVALAVMPAVADSYVGPTGVVSQCADAPLVVTGVSEVDSTFAAVTSPAAFGVGGECLKDPANAVSVTVDVKDSDGTTELPYQVSFQKADGYTSETDASGNAVYHDGCGSQQFTIPAGFEGGYVYVFANAGQACPTSNTSTGGDITATWGYPAP